MKKIIYTFLSVTMFTACKKESSNSSTTPTNGSSTTIAKYGNGVTDVEGNKYKTVIIGTQEWMGENLKVSKYSDGTEISNVIDNTQWANNTTGAWAYYNNDAANNTKYGKLYNWYAVSKTTNGNKNICPTGWHVPTDAEWTVLTDYLGGASVAGGKMKEEGTTNWISTNKNGTNTSLLTGVPGGFRGGDGNYYVMGRSAYWWSSTDDFSIPIPNTYRAWAQILYNDSGNADRAFFELERGMSVRCIKD